MTLEPNLARPPVAPREPSVRELHGKEVADDYAWMRDTDQPRLRDYLVAERAYYDTHTEHLNQLTGQLSAEAAGRFPAGDEYSVSWPLRGFTYRTRLPAGNDDLQLLRSEDGQPAEQVLLDDNLLAAKTGFVDVGDREPSPDGRLLAWSADTSGAEFYELRIRDLQTGQDLPEVISRTFHGVAWDNASRFLFYLVLDDLFRPFQVWRHEVGTPASDDALVFEEPDQRFDLTLHGSRSGALAIISSASRDTTETWIISLTAPLDDPVLIEPRRQGIEYRVDHARDGDSLYVVTDEGEPEFTLMRAPRDEPGRAGWQRVNCPAVAPDRTDTRLVQCDVLAEHLVLTIRRQAEQLLVIADRDGGNPREVASRLAAGSIRIDHSEEYRDAVIVVEESLVEPPAWYELDLETGDRQLLKRLEVPGYDPARYVTQRLTAPAADGTAIPVTLARLDSTALDGSAPCLLYGYGAYEATIDPTFGRSLPSLLDRGVVYAIAHIRGGGEGGRQWWQQGRLEHKPTTFTDFAAVADWLAGDGGPALVDPDRIVSRGASAGGLLQGAVYSMRPDRWRAVIAEVPFVDVVNTMLDPSIPLTINEWDEWGDPRKPEEYLVLRSYSPYENPPSGRRPALLVTGAVNDARVSIHEPAKWVARLRATGSSDARLLFRAEVGVGAHGGPSGRSARLRYEAEIQAFILDAVGITR
jgi:oligopeptidase B